MEINTIHGPIDDSLLLKRVGQNEDEHEVLSWVEYWYNNELVHRSVDLRLKRGVLSGFDTTNIG